MTYLQIRGTLAENMTYRARPGYESTRRGQRGEGDPAYELVLLDSEGRVLLSNHPQVTSTGCGYADDPLHYRVRGALPLHPDGAAYELRRGQVRLYAAAIPSAPPSVTAPQCRASANGVTLHWQPCEPKQETPGQQCLPAPARCTTYSIVMAMESGRRVTVARGLTEPAYRVDLTRAPVSGKGMLYIVASDGVRSAEVQAGPVEVPERPPTIHILAPTAGARVPFGQPISVLGCCLDMGGRPCPPAETEWSLDGDRLAAGTLVTVIEKPAPGAHCITFSHAVHRADRISADCTFTIDEPDEHYRQWQSLTGGEPRSRRG